MGRIRKFCGLAANDFPRVGKITFPFLTFAGRYLSPSMEHFGVMPSDDGVAVCSVAFYLCAVSCVLPKCH